MNAKTPVDTTTFNTDDNTQVERSPIRIGIPAIGTYRIGRQYFGNERISLSILFKEAPFAMIILLFIEEY
jgi:hypothetical protein